MSEIHVKEGESIDSALKRFKLAALRQALSPRFARESIMRAPASSVARSLRPLVKNKKRFY